MRKLISITILSLFFSISLQTFSCFAQENKIYLDESWQLLQEKGKVQMSALKKTPKALLNTYAVLKLENKDSLFKKNVELRVEALVDDKYLVFEKKITLPVNEEVILQRKLDLGEVDVGVEVLQFKVIDLENP
ncbi:hypothetical protein [Flammeovirga sp. OC4]|uniref:hypothetical protein n=1 Tax=Flammeovirga sp. OC4 TaxID=1382345 RepID=UPI0012E0BA3F|nr:hypothetical protein [Flammeovirga sp. OC4]